MTPNDQRLWAGLVAQALRLNRAFNAACPRGLKRAADAVNGSRKKPRSGAAAPMGMRDASSPYMRLVRLVRTSKLFDHVWRQMVLDAAYAVRNDMELRGFGAALSLALGEGSKTPPSGQEAGLPPTRQGDMKRGEITGVWIDEAADLAPEVVDLVLGRPFRADIDG